MPAWNETTWFAMLLGAALKGTIVLGAAWLLAFTLRSRSAAARHLVWTAAAAALLALPVLSLSLPALRVRNRALGAVVPPIAFHPAAIANTPSPSPARTTAPAPPSASWLPGFQFWMPRVWAAGTLVGFAQMFLAWFVMRRVRRAAHLVEDSSLFFALSYSLDIFHPVELVELPAGSMPLNFGILRPAVFVPADARHWSEDRRRVVLLHELAHVKRGDVATNLLMRTALSLFWWNPLAWTAWRHSVKERERAADDLVLTAGEAATGYASHLLDIARSMQSTTPVAWAAITMARPSQLEGRLLAILDSRIRRNAAGPRAAIAAALLAIALVAPFAAMQAQDKLDPVTAPVVDATITAATAQNNHDITDYAAAAFASTRKYDAAQKLLESSLTIRAKNNGEASLAYAVGLIKLGEVSEKRGNAADALDFYTRAVALGDKPETVPGLIYLARRAASSNDTATAESYINRALAVSPTGAAAARALTVKAQLAMMNGQPAGAEQQYLQALAQAPPNSPEAANAMEMYAAMLRSQNRIPEAQAMSIRARSTGQSRIEYMTVLPQTSPDGISRVGNGVSAPVLLSKSEPDYSQEARNAKLQGTVVLYVVVGPDGHATNMQVIKSLGLGLDEKAMEAVSHWKFLPGKRNGMPVSVEATLEVNFRLL